MIFQWITYVLIGIVITVLSLPFAVFGIRLWHSYSLNKQRELDELNNKKRMNEDGQKIKRKKAVNNKVYNR